MHNDKDDQLLAEAYNKVIHEAVPGLGGNVAYPWDSTQRINPSERALESGLKNKSVDPNVRKNTAIAGEMQQQAAAPNQPIDINQFMNEWGNKGHTIAIINGQGQIVNPAITDPADYPDMTLDKSGNGAKILTGKYAGGFLKFNPAV